MATPGPSGQHEARLVSTALKKLRTPGKGTGDFTKLQVPKLKLGPVTAPQETPQLGSNNATRPQTAAKKQDQKDGWNPSLTDQNTKSATPQRDVKLEKLSASRKPSAKLGLLESQQNSAPLSNVADIPKPPAAHLSTKAKVPQQATAGAHEDSKVVQSPPASPDFSPKKHTGKTVVPQPEETDLPLACQTAISKRR